MNVLAWSADVSVELIPIIDRLKEIGYDGVEFYVGSEDKEAYQKVGAHCSNIDMEVTTVFTLGKDENIIDPKKEVRLNGLDKIKWAIDRTVDMGANLMCGPFHSAFATFAEHAPEEQEFDWSAEMLHKAGEYAAQADVILAVEALNRFECYLCNTMTQLNHLLTKANHPNVKGMFDTHHANIEEKKIGEAIQTISPKLAHVHISENDRGTPGAGHVPWDETFSTLADLNYDGWFTIEGFTRNDPGFANAINVWRDFAQPWDMAENGYLHIKSMIEKHAN